MRLVDRKVCPAGLVSLLSEGGDPPWRLPALHPLIGEMEREKTGAERLQTTGGRSVG